jgi:transcriptional regulator with XRE-family HTH domain
VVGGSNPLTPTSKSGTKKARQGNKNLPDIKFVNKTVHKITPENPVIDIPSFLSYIHNTYGVSYRYIAEVLGISNTYLSYLRRGLRNPTPQVIQQIIQVFSLQENFPPENVIIRDVFFAANIRRRNMAAERLTLEEVIYNFLVAKQAENKSKATIKFYRENLDRSVWWFRTFSNCCFIDEISTQRLRELFVYIGTATDRWKKGSVSSRKPASKSTVDAYWRTLQSLFTWLVTEEIIEEKKNPMKKIPRPKASSQII